MSLQTIRKVIGQIGIENLPDRVIPFQEQDYFNGDRLEKPRR